MEESQSQEEVETAPEVPIPLGTRVVVDVEGIGERLESRLVGSDGQSFLLITTPESDSSGQIRDQYYLGRVVVGRFLDSGRVHGFRSHVRQALSRPSRLLFLSYPTSMEKVDLRGSQRFAALCSALLREGSEEHPGVLLDISRGGCCFRARIPENSALHQEEDRPPVTLHLSLPGAQQPLSLQGQARDCKETGNQTVELGICFAKMSPQDSQQLEKYIGLLEETV
ncbi:MAG: flagellar brake protein [Acidobacteriota bacterium]